MIRFLILGGPLWLQYGTNGKESAVLRRKTCSKNDHDNNGEKHWLGHRWWHWRRVERKHLEDILDLES